MEENHNVLLPELKEMENKVGMKTPEILLSWMGGEDANFEDVNDWRCHTSDFSGDFSDRISSLKHELVNIFDLLNINNISVFLGEIKHDYIFLPWRLDKQPNFVFTFS